MVDRLRLTTRHTSIIEMLLREHLPCVKMWVLTTRVNERSHKVSSIHLVLRGPELKKIPVERLVAFKEALRESSNSLRVRMLDWVSCPSSFGAKSSWIMTLREEEPRNQ